MTNFPKFRQDSAQKCHFQVQYEFEEKYTEILF